METHVKSTTSKPKKAKDREDGQSYVLNAGQRFFCGVGFSRSVAPNEMMPHASKDHESWVTNDGNHVMVPNLAPMTRASVHVLKPQGVAKRLNPQRGEAQCQVRLP
jgi:hypothetical protein